jgi:hypothetical protein
MNGGEVNLVLVCVNVIHNVMCLGLYTLSLSDKFAVYFSSTTLLAD